MFILILVLLNVFLLALAFYIFWRWKLLFDYNFRKAPSLYPTQINASSLSLRDGTKLENYFAPLPTAKTLIIFFHGFGAHLHDWDWLKQYCLQKNYSLLLPSRRHSGKNLSSVDAQYNLGIEVDDIDEIVTKAIKMSSYQEIIVLGHSLGAALLAEYIGRTSTQQLPIKFVLINSLTKFQTLNPFNFIEKSWTSYLLLFFAFIFNSNQILRLQTWTKGFLLHCCKGCNNRFIGNIWQLVKKYEFQPELLKVEFAKYSLCVRQMPFYYFANFFSLFNAYFSNLDKNTINPIWVVQGTEDSYSNLSKVQHHRAKMVSKTNLQFIYIQNFGHTFNPQAPFEVNANLFTRFLKPVLQYKFSKE